MVGDGGPEDSEDDGYGSDLDEEGGEVSEDEDGAIEGRRPLPHAATASAGVTTGVTSTGIASTSERSERLRISLRLERQVGMQMIGGMCAVR